MSDLFDAYRHTVEPDWIDENDHLNMGFYLVVFDKATDAWLDHIGLGFEVKRSHGVTTFTLEAHINYLKEVRRAAPLRFTTQLLGFDEKRIHYVHQMFDESRTDEPAGPAATNELMSLHVSEQTRRATPMAPEVQDRLHQILLEHREVTPPTTVGRSIGLRSRP